MSDSISSGMQNQSVSETETDHKTTQHSKTVDSGMDEGSNSSAQDAADSDDEEVISRKPSKSMHRILEDDSDVSQDVPDTGSTTKKQEYATPEEALDAVMQDSSDSENSDDDKDDDDGSDSQSKPPTTPASTKKKKIVRPVASDSSDDEEENQTLREALQHQNKETVEESQTLSKAVQSQNSEKSEEKEYATAEEALEAVMNDSSDDEDKGTQRSRSGNESSSDSDVKSSGSEMSDGGRQSGDDEGFDESSIDPKLLAKLKKGAAKKEPREKRKSRKEALVEIHSETQRMVRESRVNLPYHQPAAKPLNMFLARAKSKQEQYKVLRGFRDRKAEVVENILASTRLKAQPKSQEDMDKYSDSEDEDWNPEGDKEKSLKERLDEKFGKTDSTSEKTAATNGEEPMLTSDGGKHNGQSGEGDCDSLPEIDESQESRLDSVSCAGDRTATQTDSTMATDSACVTDVSQSQTDSADLTESLTQTEQNSVIENGEKEGDSKTNSDVNTCMSNSDKVSEHKVDCAPVDTSEALSQIDKEIAGNSDEDTEKDAQTQSSQAGNSSATKKGKSKLAALAGIDLETVKPCLSGQFDSFISLGEEEETPTNPGVLKLMDRFCKHSAKQEKKRKKDKDISVIHKDTVGLDTQELKLDTFTYHAEEEDKNPLLKLETPGAKLVALKEQLADKIKQKRERARQVRQEAYDLDNEAGARDIEEEEAEMSDRSDTDEEGGDIDEEEEGYEEEEEEEDGEIVEDEDREANPFADDEAEEDGDEGDDEMDDDDEDADDEDGMKLKLDVSDDEEGESEAEEAETEEDLVEATDEKTSKASQKSKDPEFKEPFGKKIPEKPFSMFGGSSVTSQSQFQSAQPASSLVLPVEDSQDLYGNSNMIPELLPSQSAGKATQAPQSQAPTDFSFFLEDSQSNMLDADGYLKTKSSVKKPTPSALDDLTGTQDNMGDLLGLCSGNFAATQGTGGGDNKVIRKSLFDESSASTQGHMDDLVGLCSGMFPDDRQTQADKKGTKRKVSEDSNDAIIEALSDDEQRSEKDGFSDGEEEGDTDRLEEEGDTDEVHSDEEEKPKKFSGFTTKNKHGRFLKDFVDEEAELSGSEFDSDENLDLAEEEDIMEVEEGDRLMKNVDQDELRDEIGRVHMKQIIDEDKRELLRFQEMYLPDGDLHSEGAGRKRQFKWSNIDDDTQGDMFADGSDGEPEHEENENDFEWRKERYEREQFLKQQQEKENTEGESRENSQFLKFGKVFLKKQCSVDNSVSTKEKSTKPAAKATDTTEGVGLYKLPKQKRGSFLARSKESLAKIAEKTKPIANPSAGAKTSGKFTFNVISPDKEKENVVAAPAGAKQRKAHMPKPKAPTAAKQPPAKKPKLDTQASFTENSIFNHL